MLKQFPDKRELLKIFVAPTYLNPCERTNPAYIYIVHCDISICKGGSIPPCNAPNLNRIKTSPIIYNKYLNVNKT